MLSSKLTKNILWLQFGGMKGRPKKEDTKRKKITFRFRLTEDERSLLDRAAETRSLDASAWVRSEMVAMAKKIVGEQKK
jgi:uncharacterized protein (DUF1778 family)